MNKDLCIIKKCVSKVYIAKMCKAHYVEHFKENKRKIII